MTARQQRTQRTKTAHQNSRTQGQKRRDCKVHVKNGTKFICSTTFSYQAAWQHLDSSGIAYPCAVGARYTVLYRTAIGDGLFRDVLHEDRARVALCASNAITSVVASKCIITVHVVDRGLLTLRQTRETKVDHGGSGSDTVSPEAPRNFGFDSGCPRYRCFGASDVQVGHLDHICPGRKGESKMPMYFLTISLHVPASLDFSMLDKHDESEHICVVSFL